MGKKQEEVKPGLPAWMGTYGDLVTLLLCFFVLLFASSTVDVEKLQAIALSFSNDISLIEGGGSSGINDMMGSGIMELPALDRSINNSQENTQKIDDELKQMASDFKTYFAENQMNEQVEVIQEDNYILLKFKDGILFDSGSADLKQGAIDLLSGVGDELASYTNHDIKIEGHTDDVPISGGIYKSNYYLSAARAIAVLEFLISNEGINPAYLSAEGFGEFRPLVPNDSEENRAKNRRVEIKLYSEFLE
ncbi:MAG: flagellar motor protein MotB [Lachnospirales bacterium]